MLMDVVVVRNAQCEMCMSVVAAIDFELYTSWDIANVTISFSNLRVNEIVLMAQQSS